jgi:hypothetical protein
MVRLGGEANNYIYFVKMNQGWILWCDCDHQDRLVFFW